MYWIKYSSYIYELLYNEGYSCLFTDDFNEAKEKAKNEESNIENWIYEKEISLSPEDIEAISVDWEIVDQEKVPTVAIRDKYLYYQQSIDNLKMEIKNLEGFKKYFENILVERQYNGFTRGKK